MSKRYQGGILGVGFNPLQAPNAPTIGTAVKGNTTASVAFTAPACVGGAPVSSYLVLSSPGAINASGASSPITVTGLTNCTAYTFRVTALNSYGPSPASAASNSVTPNVNGQTAYTTAGTFSFVAPAGITSVSVVTVGGGGGYACYNCICEGRAGGGGGALAYKNNISVTPGCSYAVIVGSASGTGVGGTSSFINTSTVAAGGGTAPPFPYRGGTGGVVVAGTGFAGGNGASAGGAAVVRSGAGGAGGYAGVGGNGSGLGSRGGIGAGGGGGGGAVTACPYSGGAGGGVGILGQGTSGAGGYQGSTLANANGSAGSCGSGQLYGGGTSTQGLNSGTGAVRIIYPGNTRSFPSTNTGNL